MQNFTRLLQIVSKSDIPVLLCGESGVGKEVAAKKIHAESNRHKKPFIALNCGAIPYHLTESILEGAEKGSFTGAYTNQKGLVRAAEGGTLFLDEIGELPIQSQTRLLRILQEKSVLPLGASKEIPVHFRLICATNKNLQKLVEQKLFRADLFFRLNVFPINIPPLRNRLEDFRTITFHIWEQIITENNLPKSLSENDLKLLQSYQWPGNIRQLQNVLQRYFLLKDFGGSLLDILKEEPKLDSENTSSKERQKAPPIEILKKTLLECNNNKTRTAKKLGISRGSLCYQLRQNYL